MKKNYVHAPKPALETEIIKASLLDPIKDRFFQLREEGDELELVLNHSPQKSLELKNQISYYLLDVAKYLITHKKSDLNYSPRNYIEATLSWNIFLKLAIGKYKNQYKRFVDEIRKSQQYCYIPCPKEKGGGYYIMPPFRLEFKTVDLEKLPEVELKKLSNISRQEQRYDTVTFSIAKPLVDETRGWYQHPINLTAKIIDTVHGIKENLEKDPKIKQELKDIDLEGRTVVQHYIKFIDYLYQNGAGDPKHTKISVNSIDLIQKVLSNYYYKIDRKGRVHKYARKISQFVTMASIILTELDGLDYKIIPNPTTKRVFESDPNDANRIVFQLEHPERVKRHYNIPDPK